MLLGATGLALAIRLYLLSRLRYLTGITEYDDGVYLGGAVNVISGSLPYRDFAFVQPPGILLAMAPVALLAKVWTVSGAMAAARLLTVAVSAGCVALAGSLVRHRGPLVTLVACGALALYPDDIITAHTLLLEPWMNFLLLAGARVAFQRGHLAPPRRLWWSGVLFGLAGAVKYWAVLPALGLVVCCLVCAGLTRARRRKAAGFAVGAAARIPGPVVPFASANPALFVRSTLLDQASRAGSAVPASLRLAHLTGLADLLNAAGRLTAAAGAHSLFARGDVTATATWATGALPVALAVTLAALLAAGYVLAPGREPLAWYALGTLAATVAAVLAYSAFFYHYADFAAPWLALAGGYAAGALAGVVPGRPRRPGSGRPGSRGWGPVAGCCVALALVAGFQARELSGLRASDVSAEAALIPPGACVVTDEASLTIAANRFTAGRDGCPDVLDSLAVTLVADNGLSVQGGAGSSALAVATWEDVFTRAPYVWLSSSSDRRIPWTTGLRRWFAARFRPLRPDRAAVDYGQLYIRR